jgi:hypothetical protein
MKDLFEVITKTGPYLITGAIGLIGRHRVIVAQYFFAQEGIRGKRK